MVIDTSALIAILLTSLLFKGNDFSKTDIEQVDSALK